MCIHCKRTHCHVQFCFKLCRVQLPSTCNMLPLHWHVYLLNSLRVMQRGNVHCTYGCTQAEIIVIKMVVVIVLLFMAMLAGTVLYRRQTATKHVLCPTQTGRGATSVHTCPLQGLNKQQLQSSECVPVRVNQTVVGRLLLFAPVSAILGQHRLS